MDAFDHQRESGKINSGAGHVNVSIDISQLEAGVYTVITDGYGQVGRFVKM